MCGIAGILIHEGDKADVREVTAMTRALAHRGPDGEHVHLLGSIGLGHRRLAVLDLQETGQQPMSYLDGRYWITYNGEIYNYLELRRELSGYGHRFRGNSDTEVILAAFVEWGESCQLRFNGMWAFAIWDSLERKLFLSRDRFGVKPLFYYFEHDRFAFASEMKAFLPLPWFSMSFDPSALALSLSNPYALEPTETCLLKGLKRLRSGHSITICQGGEPRVRRWWRTADHLEEVPKSFRGQVEGFRERFLDAVSIRTRSDIPVACSLSGGMDSSSIVASLHGDLGEPLDSSPLEQPLTAFIASFPGTSHDEVEFAKEVARHVGIRTRIFEVEPDVLPSIFDDVVFQVEEIQSPNLGPWLLYAEMSKAGFRVSMEGHGGDELLAGYASEVQFARDQALFPFPSLRRAVELTSILRRMTGQIHRETELRDWFRTGKRYGVLSKAGLGGLFRRSKGSGRCALPRWIKVPALEERAEQIVPVNERLSPLMGHLFLDFHVRSIPGVLRDFDRYSMGHGVEVRSPFMDWRVVCYSLSLPSNSVLGGGFTKRVLREAMRGLLPERVRTRPGKIPFKSPMSEWWRGPLLELVRDTVSSDAFLSNEIWDGPGLRNLVERSTAHGRFGGALMVLRFVVAQRLLDLFRSSCVGDSHGIG